jgi:hypothetical protein
MKIKLNQDSEILMWDSLLHDSEEFYKKGHTFDVDYVGMSTSSGDTKFPQFQNGDGSVFILATEAFTILESCEDYNSDLSE